MELYNSLREVLWRVPSTDKLIIAGDFDARVRKEMDKWPLVIRPHRVGKCNSNGELLLATLLGTQFGHHKHYLQTQGTSQDHMDAPCSKHWHLLRLCNSTAGRPKWHLEHKIHERRGLFKHSRTAAKPSCEIDVMKLRDKDIHQKLTKKKDRAFAGLKHQESEDVEVNWNCFKTITYDTAESVLKYR